MKKKNNMFQKKLSTKTTSCNLANNRFKFAVSHNLEELITKMGSSLKGLNARQVEESREQYGNNVMNNGKKNVLYKRIFNAFVNPFTAVLFLLAVISIFTDIVFAAANEKNYTTVVIVSTMVMISGVLKFAQESKSGNAASKLQNMIETTACVERFECGKKEIPLHDIVVGDIVHLSAGDIIPADMRIIYAKDLFVSQAALTGESNPIEKFDDVFYECNNSLTDIPNLALMGSTVISGSAVGVVIAVGNSTIFGGMAKMLNEKPTKTSFEKGINSVSWLLIRFMLVMVPIVLFINGFTKGDWFQAFMFAISVAVGLTPEMLPMIVTTNLAKGAITMSKKKVIVKNLNAIQNFGSIDILCTDKTGTLTQDKVVLEHYLNIHGDEDKRILRHAYLNSYFQTGLKNLIDLAVIERQDSFGSEKIKNNYIKVDEIPFDFSRRRMSVVVADTTGKTQLVTKGAVEEMLECCTYAEYEGKVVNLTDDIRSFILKKTDELNSQGMRVLAVAHKTNPAPVNQFSVSDESNMVLIGFLALLDPPKETAASAIKALNEYGVSVKILTGDNDIVTKCIATKVGLSTNEILLGSDIDNMTDDELAEKAEHITVFAKLSPEQKERVIRLLRTKGHSVGYMGDGINDAAAMKASDIGVSVDTAVDIAKESADVILLEKDLNVLADGIIEGRKTYANTIKYIKMTASSNFGNMFSVLVASAFLPFLPMQSIHLILLNLIYDISCIAIPWDNVDADFIKNPRKWNASLIGKFMLWIGPTSSLFDIITFIVMYFIICPTVCGEQFSNISNPQTQALFISVFQAGWFIESMWSQSLVIHMIRSDKIPFIQSRASLSVMILSLVGIGTVTLIPFTPLGTMLGFASLHVFYFVLLVLTIICYMLLVTAIKKLYISKYGEML